MTPVNLDLKGDLTPIIESSNRVLKPVSAALAGIFSFVFQKPIQYNIVSEIELEELAKSTRNKFDEIPYENRNFENIKQIGKILDDSIYQLDNKQFREYYAGLIASSCDNRKHVKPFYSSLMREMSSEDAGLFEYFLKYSFLFEVQITSSNHLFTNPNLYNWYWPKRYFKSNSAEPFQVFRDFIPEEAPKGSVPLENMYTNNKDYTEVEVETPVLFLLSKNLIQEDPSVNCHQLIPSIKKYVFENDDQAQKFVKRNEYSTPKVVFDIKHKVYTLTSLGQELKKVLIDGTNTIIDENVH